MRRSVILFFILIFSFSAYAENKQRTGKQIDPPTTLATFNNSFNWLIDKNDQQLIIQNSTTPAMLVDVWVSPQTNNKVTDPAYMVCGSNITLMQPSVDYLCNIDYTSLLAVTPSPFTNGASGRYYIVGKMTNVSPWSINTVGTKTIMQNTTGMNINVYYYVDNYVNNSANPSDTVDVNCINKTFSLSAGNGRICMLPPNGTAQVQLSSNFFRYGSSGGFMIVPA